jgi:Sigma-54 interaction domain
MCGRPETRPPFGDGFSRAKGVGRSPAMQEIYRALARLMQTDLTVVITGESGTGKELVARALHDYGKRKKGPFVAINMAAIGPLDDHIGLAVSEEGTHLLQPGPQKRPETVYITARRPHDLGKHAPPFEAGDDLPHQRIVRSDVKEDEAVRMARATVKAVQ